MARTNPRRIPMTQADVDRAKLRAIGDATRMASAIFLTVLVDKFDMAEQIPDVWNAVNKLSNEILEGYVTVADLVHTLKEEYDINV